MEECLELQLSELELLSSMYPGQEEMVFDNPAAADTIRRFLDGDRTAVSSLEQLPTLSFSLNLPCSATAGEFHVKMHCRLGPSYPVQSTADVHVSSDAFSRPTQRDVNEKLRQRTGGMLGESILLDLVQWLQETAAEYVRESHLTSSAAAGGGDDGDAPGGVAAPGPGRFARIWLYMHHIYSKHKRKDILEWAHELRLTGFCLPGKPGVVCVEGEGASVDEFFQRLRSMTWKRMTCRHREEVTVGDGDGAGATVEELCAFSGFGEMNFDAHGGRHNHMDMGLFYRYLQERKLGHMFQVLFGIEGRGAVNDDDDDGE